MKKSISIVLLSIVTLISVYLILKPNPFNEYQKTSFDQVRMIGILSTISPHKKYLFFCKITDNFVFYQFIPKKINNFDYNNGWVVIVPKNWIWGSAEEYTTIAFYKEF